jgi:hypothetical protein
MIDKLGKWITRSLTNEETNMVVRALDAYADGLGARGDKKGAKSMRDLAKIIDSAERIIIV